MERFTSAGVPAASIPAGISVSGNTTDPAATSAPSPTTAPSSTCAPFAISARAPIVAPWITALCATDASSPMSAGAVARPCTTAPSWMFAPGPMTAYDVSPRTTAPYQMDAPSSMRTSPTTVAVGAMKALSWIAGTFSPTAYTGIARDLPPEMRAYPNLSQAEVEMAESLGRYRARRLTGDERLPAGASVSDFWRWIGSDLVGNTTRGLFAEYLVGLAVGALVGDDSDDVRDEWGSHDLTTPDGITIEVKSSAYMQTWRQEKEAAPEFSIAETQGWDSDSGQYSEKKKRRSDVYVFCLLNHRTKATLDPLNAEQWTFYVVPTARINEVVPSQKKIRLGPLEKKLGARRVAFDGIAEAVRQAAPSRR